MRVDKLADFIARHFKKHGIGSVDEASIIDEYVAMVNISRNVSLTNDQNETPHTTQRSMIQPSMNLHQPSNSRSTMLGVPDLYQSHFRFEDQTNGKNQPKVVPDDSVNDCPYHLITDTN